MSTNTIALNEFIHLHLHTDYSLLDGLMKYKSLFKRLNKLNMNKVAITNHGNIINMPEMIMKGAEAGIQVIPGCEVYVCWDYPATIKDDDHKETYHLILLAKNQVGYNNLIKLVSRGHLEGKYYKPRVDRKMIEEHSEGLICLSACLAGYVARSLGKDNKEYEDIKASIDWFKEIFKDDFYLEVQEHSDLPEQGIANTKILQIAKDQNINVVATCDSHYADPSYFEGWKSMMLLQTNFKFGNDVSNDYYVKSANEMKALFPNNPEVITNTIAVANKCEPIVFDKSVKYPPFNCGNLSADEYLLKCCSDGLETRIRNKQIDERKRKMYEDRYIYECKVLAEKNFSTYILIVAEFITWAKDRGILIGCGRGSAAGSLVCYLTRVTEVDPLVEDYDLIFERFINPERPSFPDIDTDFEDSRRDEVKNHMYELYGHDKVCSIATLGTLAAKGALREACRRYQLSFPETNDFAKLIPPPVRGVSCTLEEALAQSNDLQQALLKPNHKKIFDLALMIEGVSKSAGTHAAGLIVSNSYPLNHYIGLQLDKEGNVVSSDTMKSLETLGFIKFDFLGLKTLGIIQETRKNILINHDLDIDIYNIPTDDPKVFDMICAGNLAGVFQFGGSSGFKSVTMLMQPRTIGNLSDVNAIYRPGPLDNGFPEEYAKNKKLFEEGKPIKYMMTVDNPEKQKEIEKILNKTYGVCLYQEQIQYLAQAVGGYTLGGADLLRRAIGKKDPVVMEQQRKVFVAGCVKNKISEKSANELFDQIDKFAGYCFNKSHSVTYGVTAYWTAWLKYYYPNEFMAANLTFCAGDQDKTLSFINACRDEGIKILPPDLNRSDYGYTPTKDGIRFGLSAIKGIGESAIKPILEEREKNGFFTNLFSFLERIIPYGKVKKSDVSNLIKSNCI